jgi:hypothetical protein
MNNTFEVQYTIRLYDPSLISELALQYEKEATTYKNKNEFMTNIILLGLKAKKASASGNKKSAQSFEDEKDDLYALLLKVFDYIAAQFKSVYVKETMLENLLCSVYHIALSLNNGESLFAEKIESGFYDNIPARFEKLLDELMKEIGLSDKK